ncbi:hypothetical protein OIU77_014410, partial [Salix suchowensis]
MLVSLNRGITVYVRCIPTPSYGNLLFLNVLSLTISVEQGHRHASYNLFNQSQVEGGDKNYKNELKTMAYADLLLADSRVIGCCVLTRYVMH